MYVDSQFKTLISYQLHEHDDGIYHMLVSKRVYFSYNIEAI